MFLTVLGFSDVLWMKKMSRSPCHWTLSCLPSSLLSSSFNFILFLFWAIQPIHYTHTHTNSINHLSPAAWRPKKKIFLNILGRQVAGESSDLLGCVCVCCVCVCVGGPFSLPLSLFTLYPFIVTTSSVMTTLFFFPCRSSSVEEGELSLHPSIFHPFFTNPVVTSDFLFLPLCSLLVD